ncbi:MAG: FMN-binding glutamate synthase family protein [Epsilonproteobacteria bacterium]|nr:FMN-binding glutamate synthase family protein [Campylobacterota bacterium]
MEFKATFKPFSQLAVWVKLNWKDYFSAAAMAGICCVIGENSPSKDPNLQRDINGKIVHFEKLKEMKEAFSRYDRGYGQIILQCNLEDFSMGLAEYAIIECGFTAIEFKFGQSAKGTQPAVRMSSLEEALSKKKSGMIVHPNPEDPEIIKLYEKNACPEFWYYSRLPMWTEETLKERIQSLRSLGLKNVYFKMAGFDRRDIEEVLRLASILEVDLVTFDGAGGGSGYSPSKMMNEWGLPALCIESALPEICERLQRAGLVIPDIAITGGMSSEDHVYKALAIGAPYVKLVGLCRSPMAAAMVGEKVGELLENGMVPKHLERYGQTKETLFRHLPELRGMYGKEADRIPLGAIGAYSYLQKIAFGVRHFAALNRKFDVKYIDKKDVIPMTRDAKDILNGTWF